MPGCIPEKASFNPKNSTEARSPASTSTSTLAAENRRLRKERKEDRGGKTPGNVIGKSTKKSAEKVMWLRPGGKKQSGGGGEKKASGKGGREGLRLLLSQYIKETCLKSSMKCWRSNRLAEAWCKIGERRRKVLLKENLSSEGAEPFHTRPISHQRSPSSRHRDGLSRSAGAVSRGEYGTTDEEVSQARRKDAGRALRERRSFCRGEVDSISICVLRTKYESRTCRSLDSESGVLPTKHR